MWLIVYKCFIFFSALFFFFFISASNLMCVFLYMLWKGVLKQDGMQTNNPFWCAVIEEIFK